MQSIQQDSSSVKINFVDELPFLSSQKLINEYAQKVIPLEVGSKLNNSRNVQRFELKWNDDAVSGGKRSEMVYNSVTAKELWNTFGTYLEDFISDSYSVIIFQLHGVPDKNEAYREPNIAIAINGFPPIA